MIERLIRAGMDCARLNFSHGTLEDHLRVLERVRAVSRRTRNLVAVMQDLPWPKLRVGKLKNGPLHLKKESKVVLATGDRQGQADVIPVESKDLSRFVKRGGKIFLFDGAITLRVTATTESTIETVCEVGGVVRSGNGVNVPDLTQDFETFTEQDRRYLAFGLEQGVDMVAVSFVRNASDVEAVRRFIGKEKRASPLIVAKIEKKEAVENLAGIVEATDAVMVARGDLGAENPIEEVPEMQKSIIAFCRSRGVPVITATQMLESMVNNARPTRAEVTDVANAILDGTDAVMLSEETALGQYPVECVGVMNRVALRAEARMLKDQAVRSLGEFRSKDLADAFSASAWQLSEDIGARVIAVRSGDEAIIPKVSRFRPSAVIVHTSEKEELLRRSRIIWGVFQDKVNGHQVSDKSLDSSVQSLVRGGYLAQGDRAVFIRDINSSAKYARFSVSAVVAGEAGTAGDTG